MIPVSLIRQYHFCPRIVYFALLTDIKPIYPQHVAFGLAYHEVQERLSKHRKFKKLGIEIEEILLNQFLEDTQLGIYGKVDLALLTPDEIVPVEFKYIQAKKPSYAHILQLYGYGRLLEVACKKPVKRLVIIHSNNVKLFNIEVTSKIEDDFLKTVTKIKTIVDNAILPDSSASDAKCLQCEYLNFCDDRF